MNAFDRLKEKVKEGEFQIDDEEVLREKLDKININRQDNRNFLFILNESGDKAVVKAPDIVRAISKFISVYNSISDWSSISLYVEEIPIIE